MVRKPTQRMDVRLVAEGLAADLHEAQALVLSGRAMAGEQKVWKPGTPVDDRVPVRLAGTPPLKYVSRGGLKLESALDALGIDPPGLRCVDVGASTGGFTDCLLQRGAVEVVAVDVGHNLLADRIRRDPRVRVLEKTHAKVLTPQLLPWPADLVVVDLSFIGSRTVLPALVPLLASDGRLLVMVKPQFELPRELVQEGGVVRNDADRKRAVDDVAQAALELGMRELGRVESGVAGPMGNREVFLLLAR
ncbi:MAG: TlyA family RNA methyltransferase [Myxococcota bacterium]